MLRRTLLYLSENTVLRRWMENSPVSQRFTSRFIAGRSLEEGIRVLKQLSLEQILGTLDFLGENVTSLHEAAQSRDCCMAALAEIDRARLRAAHLEWLAEPGR